MYHNGMNNWTCEYLFICTLEKTALRFKINIHVYILVLISHVAMNFVAGLVFQELWSIMTIKKVVKSETIYNTCKLYIHWNIAPLNALLYYMT